MPLMPGIHTISISIPTGHAVPLAASSRQLGINHLFKRKNQCSNTVPVIQAFLVTLSFSDYNCTRAAMPPIKAPMPAAAVCAQATPPVLLLLLLLVADEEVDVELLTTDAAACRAEDALLTLAATWLSWELMEVEAAASAVESWEFSEDEAEAAEEVMFANSLLNSLSKDDSNDW